MKFITICIYVFLSVQFISCKKVASSTREMPHNSMENIETKLETLCLNSKNDSMVFSMKITYDSYINDYIYKYLGLLQVNKRCFEVLQKTVFSGQNKDSQRASVFIRFFSNEKLYGEYAGLNNFYSIKISSNIISIYNADVRSCSRFEIKDSIPQLLFFPYNNKDSSSSGEKFYFNRY